MKTTWRVVPCPMYDIEGLQSWLEDMAAQGWFLVRFHLGCTLARFYRDEPETVRYRFSATRQPSGPLDLMPDLPDAEEWQLSSAAGWHYVAPLNEFFLYRCEDPAMPDLNTDPQVQALSLKAVRKNIFWWVVYLLWLTLFSPAINFWGEYALALVELGPSVFIMLLLELLLAAAVLVRVLHVEGLYRRLKRGIPMRLGKDWRKYSMLHYLQSTLPLALTVVFLILFFQSVGWKEDTRRALTDHTEPLPFATLKELVDGDTVIGEPVYKDGKIYNSISVGGGPLAPVMIDFQQDAVIQKDGETVLNAAMFVDYYETISPRLARQIGRELMGKWPGSTEDKAVSIELDNIDEAYICAQPYGLLMMRKGCRVISITYFTNTEQDLQLEEAAPIMAEYFAQ